MPLDPNDLSETTRTIVAELSAVDACGPDHWTAADQVRYVRLLVEQGIDEMARSDDAQHEYMADCVMLAIQNMQDARLQMVEDRLEVLENPDGPSVKDFVVDTALMLGFELLVVAGIEFALPAVVLMAAAKAQGRAARRLADAEVTANLATFGAGVLATDVRTRQAVARLTREQSVKFPGPRRFKDELIANRELAHATAKLQAAQSAATAGQAALLKAQAAMTGATSAVEQIQLRSAGLHTFLHSVTGGTALGRVAENLSSNLTDLVTSASPGESSPDGPAGTRTYLSSVVGAEFLSEIRTEQEVSARSWRALKFYVRFIPDAQLLSDETAQELYLRARLFAAHSSTWQGLLASRDFLVLGMEAQLWLAWLRHRNALGQRDVPDFVVHPGFPPHGTGPGKVHEDKLVTSASLESSPSRSGSIESRTRAKGVAYRGIPVLTDGHADYLYHRFARDYFLRNPSKVPKPMKFAAARYDEVASMSPETILGFTDLERRDRIAEMKLLTIVFFQKLAENPAAISDGVDSPAAAVARPLLRSLLEMEESADPVAEYVASLPQQSQPDAPASSEEPPVDLVLGAVALVVTDPEVEAQAAAARLGSMVTDLDLAITQHPSPQSFPDTPQGRLDKALADELADLIVDQQAEVLAQLAEFRRLAKDLPSLLADTGARYDERINQLTMWTPTGTFTGPIQTP
jgi:hypothetical protein